jgi:putative transposase
MPRVPRNLKSGLIYHVINRGNGKARVFHKPQDYDAFLDLLVAAKQRQPIKLFAFCLMPNHFHFVVEPENSLALSRFMQWLMTSHVRRYHQHYESSGHVWQGRFKSFPIQRDAHLITVFRYVCQNPVRAALVTRSIEWPWSGIVRTDLIDSCPVEFDPLAVDSIDLTLQQLTELRCSVNGQQPFGTDDWRRTT